MHEPCRGTLRVSTFWERHCSLTLRYRFQFHYLAPALAKDPVSVRVGSIWAERDRGHAPLRYEVPANPGAQAPVAPGRAVREDLLTRDRSPGASASSVLPRR
jgi:hypothetical protein